MSRLTGIRQLNETIIQCARCPRLVEFIQSVALTRKREYQNWRYWGKPLPGWGDLRARLLVVGLAPAAHGANRTGRMFTGDSSGDFLARVMHECGFAEQPFSRQCGDGQKLRGAYLTAVVRCAPPLNRPSAMEKRNCLPFLEEELRLLREVAVIICLGKFAWDGVWEALSNIGALLPRPRVSFGHGKECCLRHPLFDRELYLLSSYHPSRQNTNTGKLTTEMFRQVFARAREILDGGPHPSAIKMLPTAQLMD